MSDQNRFDEYKQKLLHYWSLFLAACGRILDKVKIYTGKTVAFLRRCADWIAENVGIASDVAAAWARKILRKVAVWLLKARGWFLKKWDRYAKPVLQKLAAWLLMVRQKLQPGIDKVKGWGTAAKEWLRKHLPKRKALPPVKATAPAVVEAPAETPVLPAVEETAPVVQNAVEDNAAEEPAETAAPRFRVTNPVLAKILAILGIIGKCVKLVIKWLWKLRTIFMAIPVVWAAVKLAMENMDRLPDRVGLDIQSSGEFAHMITRTEAVYWPLGITAFCLVLMFCSKKPLLPWVISIFTLVLPVLLWVLNYYA